MRTNEARVFNISPAHPHPSALCSNPAWYINSETATDVHPALRDLKMEAVSSHDESRSPLYKLFRHQTRSRLHLPSPSRSTFLCSFNICGTGYPEHFHLLFSFHTLQHRPLYPNEILTLRYPHIQDVVQLRNQNLGRPHYIGNHLFRHGCSCHWCLETR